MFEKIFKLSEHGTTVKQEVIAGLTTFLAMAYILFVNSGMLGELEGLSYSSVFFATAISAAISSILMGLYANYPVALAPGMGANAFFTYTVCFAYGYTAAEALAGVFVSGIIFLVISVTGLRKAVINAIPKNMKLAIGAGIGFFIAYIALQNGGIIVASATVSGLGNFHDPVVLLSVFGIVVTFILMSLKVNGASFIGMIITAVVGVIAGLMGVAGMPTLPTGLVSLSFDTSAVGLFLQGFGGFFSHSNWLLVIFTFLFVDFFDTAGTLVAVGNNIGLVDENGEMKDVEKALLSDSVGTVIGSCVGTSTVTSFVESGAGVAAGGRTGLTAVVTGICFLLSTVFSPVLSVVTSAVTTCAIFTVGVLMAQQLKNIDWEEFEVAAPAFVTVIFMTLAYSISDGLALGFIVYGACMAAAKRTKEVSPVCWGLIALFILYFILG